MLLLYLILTLIVDSLYSILLKSGNVDASIEQLVHVLPGESYEFVTYLATNKKGRSPTITISLEYLDENLTPINNGLEIVIDKGQYLIGGTTYLKGLLKTLPVCHKVHILQNL